MKQSAKSRGISAARTALRALWFAVIPALLVAVIVRYALLPDVYGSTVIAGAWREYPVPFAVGLFLIFALLIRYWRFYLPGGRYLSSLPLDLAAGLRRNELATYAAAADLAAWLSQPSVQGRLENRLADQPLSAYRQALDALRKAINGNELASLGAAQHAVKKAVQAELRRRAYTHLAATVMLIAGAAGLALLMKQHVVRLYEVQKISMLPSLEPGDRVAANHLAYGLRSKEPRRGDLVVFRRAMDGAAEEDLVKRVIGLPGDLIEMRGSHPIINGWRVPSCDAGLYAYLSDGAEVLGRVRVEYLEDRAYLAAMSPSKVPFESYRVQAGEVFVLGDNRNYSIDSRAWDHGKPAGLPVSAIAGRVDGIFLKPELGPVTWSALLRRPGLEINVPGLDVSGIRDGIQRCLAQRPTGTSPPKPPEAPREARQAAAEGQR